MQYTARRKCVDTSDLSRKVEKRGEGDVALLFFTFGESQVREYKLNPR